MMASIDLTTSLPMSEVCASACSASVRTARSTASLASSVFGLNSLRRSESKSVTPTAAVVACADSCCGFVSAISLLHWSVHGLHRLGAGVARRRERLQERGVLQELRDEVLGAALAVHVRDQVGELLAGLEQLAEGVHLPGHGPGREVVHALEG